MSANTASPDNAQFETLLGSLRQRLPKIILASSAAAVLTFAICSALAPRYLAEAQLQLAAGGDNEALRTHLDALASWELAAEVVHKLHLEQKVEFNSALGSPDVVSRVFRLAGVGAPRAGESDEARVLGTFQHQLQVHAGSGTGSIGVRFTSLDPALAAGIANTLSETYAQRLSPQASATQPQGAENPAAAQPKSGDANSAYQPDVPSEPNVPSEGAATTAPTAATADIEARVAALTAEMAAAEAEIAKSRGEVATSATAKAAATDARQLSKLNAELARASVVREEAESKARTARELARKGNAEALPDAQQQPVVQALVMQRVRLERQISELSATLLPEHPRMRQLNADLAGLKKQIANETGRLVDSLEKDAKVAAAREAAVEKSIDALKSRAAASDAGAASLVELERLAAAKRAELQQLEAELAASRARPEAMPAADAKPAADAVASGHTSEQPVVGAPLQIVSRAEVPTAPIFPKTTNYAALAFLAVFLVGVALALVRSAIAVARPARGRGAGKVAARTLPAANPAAVGEPVAAHATASSPRPVESHPAQPGSSTAAPSYAAVPASTIQTAGMPMDHALYDEAPLSLDEIAETIAVLPQQPTGFRTLVAGQSDAVDAGFEAIEIGCALADKGMATVVVEWSPEGFSMARELERNASPGMNELVTGSATFEQVVTSIPGSDVHFIAAGAPIARPGDVVDPDLVNLLLDALDEAYEHIIVVGRYDAARALFESILGRFDAGVLVSQDGASPSRRHAAHGMFLGFEVTDIAVMKHERHQELEGFDGAGQSPAASQIAPVYAQPVAARANANSKVGTAANVPAAGAKVPGAPAAKTKAGFSLPSLGRLGRKSEGAGKGASPGKSKNVEEAPAYPPVPQAELVARALRRAPPVGRTANA